MSKLNSEFNYRTQVVGETTWEKIKTIQGFLAGRKRAAVLEQVHNLQTQARLAELEFLNENNGAKHVILNLQAEILEYESSAQEAQKAYQDNRDEIEILERYLAELYEQAEPTRIEGYSDEQMFEANACNEFTVWVAREIAAEIIATGHPSPMKLRNAMSNPTTFQALQHVGLIPMEAKRIEGNINPLHIELKPIKQEKICLQ